MRKIAFLPDAFEQFNFWSREDRRTQRRIADLIRDISRDPFQGIGKPEALKNDLKGLWSRRTLTNIGWCTRLQTMKS